MHFHTEVTVKFYQIDAGGVLFYGNLFTMAHDAFESFLKALSIEWSSWFQNPEWGMPIRRTEAEYLKPMIGGETYRVEIQVQKLGETSFTLGYRFLKGDVLYATSLTSHVFIELMERSMAPLRVKGSRSIPDSVRDCLSTYKAE